MSQRSTQLNNQLCDQDKLILNLFKNQTVNYVGTDQEFAQYLTINNNSSNLILILNDALWLSEIYQQLQRTLTLPVTTFYIGINRYKVLGNDTNIKIDSDDTLVSTVKKIVTSLNYTVTKFGVFDNDQGRYFNFIQPLTWLYGTYNATN